MQPGPPGGRAGLEGQEAQQDRETQQQESRLRSGVVHGMAGTEPQAKPGQGPHHRHDQSRAVDDQQPIKKHDSRLPLKCACLGASAKTEPGRRERHTRYAQNTGHDQEDQSQGAATASSFARASVAQETPDRTRLTPRVILIVSCSRSRIAGRSASRKSPFIVLSEHRVPDRCERTVLLVPDRCSRDAPYEHRPEATRS